MAEWINLKFGVRRMFVRTYVNYALAVFLSVVRPQKRESKGRKKFPARPGSIVKLIVMSRPESMYGDIIKHASAMTLTFPSEIHGRMHWLLQSPLCVSDFLRQVGCVALIYPFTLPSHLRIWLFYHHSFPC